MGRVVVGLLVGMAWLSPQGAGAGASTPRERYEALLREYEAADAAWNGRYDTSAGDQAKVDWNARYADWPGWSFARRFVELAEATPGDPAAMDALYWVVDRALRVGVDDREFAPSHRRALGLLTEGHRFEDRRLKAACVWALTYPSPQTERLLRIVLSESKDRDVRGLACLCLARLLANRRDLALSPWFEGEGMSPLEKFRSERLDTDTLAYIRRTDVEAAR
jgi:hypothetical protein